MKRSLTFVAAALFLFSAGCGDSPTESAPEDALRAIVDQSGGGAAWHGYGSPAVAYDPEQSPFELCATWSDGALFTRDGGLYASTDFFSFDFHRADEGGAWVKIGSARNDAATRRGCFVVGELAEGVHAFQVTAVARHGRAKGTTTHHTASWTVQVEIGEVEPAPFTVVISPASATIGVDGTKQFSVLVKDSEANEVASPVVTWHTDDAAVANIDAGGLATGAGKGQAKISVEYLGIRSDGNLIVRATPVVEIDAPAADAKFAVGALLAFSGSAVDSEGAALTGEALVWTSDLDGQIGTGVGFSSTELSPGDHVVTLTAKDGEGLEGEQTVSIVVEAAEGPPEVQAGTISAGSYHSCGLSAAGVAYCWGSNQWGALGDGTYTNRSVPTPVATGLTFKSITAADDFTVALSTTGAAYAWGSNTYGRLGDGTTLTRPSPVAVAGGHTFAYLSAGDLHTVALTPAGVAYAWGHNQFDKLGTAVQSNHSVPTLVVGGLTFGSIAAGADHTVAITLTGVAYAWGGGGSGQLGDGTNLHRAVPTPVAGGHTFKSVQAGFYHTVGLTTAGVAYAWGSNQFGGLGDGVLYTNSASPTPVAGGHTFTSIDAGGYGGAGLTAAGAAYTWGGGNAIGGSLTPVAVSGGLTFRSIAKGYAHTLAITTAGAAYAWGQNADGRLGDGTTTDRSEPVTVSGSILF